MGCPCREIRRVIARWLPGGKQLVGLLPDLPPERGSEPIPAKGSEPMGSEPLKMLARVAGQSFHLVSGNSYYADENRVIRDIDIHDVAALRLVGCEVLPEEQTEVDTAAAESVETHAVGQAFEDAPEAELEAAEHEVDAERGE